MYSKGEQVHIKRSTKMYRASDEPQNISGAVQAGTLATVVMGPHMGKHLIKTDDGQSGWVANGDIERA